MIVHRGQKSEIKNEWQQWSEQTERATVTKTRELVAKQIALA